LFSDFRKEKISFLLAYLKIFIKIHGNFLLPYKSYIKGPYSGIFGLLMKTDKELVELLKEGDNYAFITLYNRYKRQIYVFCLRMVNDNDAAMDIVQDVFLKVYEKNHTIKNPASFKSWIYTIARNSCLTFLSRSKNSVGFTYEIENKCQETPANDYDKQENEEIVKNSLNKLKSEYREIIILKDYLDYSYQEIAEILDLKNGAVKSRLFKARKKIYELISPFFKGE
jgi:RNA polymerase sigma-70 factor, ECF subfamily